MRSVFFLNLCFLCFGAFAQNVWQHKHPVLGHHKLHAVDVINETTAYVVGAYGMMYKTVDRGNTWTNIASLNFNNDFNHIHFPSEKIGYASARDGGIHKTEDGGRSWYIISSDFLANPVAMYFIDETTGYVFDTFGGAFKSSNGGRTWLLEDRSNNRPVRGLVFVTSNVAYGVGLSGLIVRTSNGGGSWTNLSSGIQSNLYAVDFLNFNIGVAVGQGVIARTTNGGQSWTTYTNLTDVTLRDVKFINNDTVICVGDMGTILVSYDRGESWSKLDSGVLYELHGIDSHGDFITVVGGKSGYGAILTSVDGGDNWRVTEPGYGPELYDMHFPHESIGYTVGKSGHILKTIDNGDTWTKIDAENIQEDLTSVFFVDKDTGYVSGSYVGYKTSDGGNTWVQSHFFGDKVFCYDGKVAMRLQKYYTESESPYGWMDLEHTALELTIDEGVTWMWVAGSDFLIGGYGPLNTTIETVFWLDENVVFAVISGSSPYWVEENNFETAGGVIRSLNGGMTWELIYSNNNMLYDAHFIDKDLGFVVGDNGLVAKIMNGGRSHIQYHHSYNSFSGIYFLDENVGYSFDKYRYGMLQMTNDGGVTWIDQKRGGETFNFIYGKSDRIFVAGKMENIQAIDIVQDVVTSISLYFESDNRLLISPNPVTAEFEFIGDIIGIESVEFFDGEGRFLERIEKFQKGKVRVPPYKGLLIVKVIYSDRVENYKIISR